MKTSQQIVDGLIADLPKVHAMQRQLAIEHIEKALNYFELSELIEIAEQIHAKQFALGEIATHRTELTFNELPF